MKKGYDNTDKDTLIAIKATALVAKLAYKLLETEAEILRRTLGYS